MVYRKKQLFGILGSAIAAMLVGGSATSSATAAPITWQTPQSVNSADPTQVFTAGTLVDSGTNFTSDVTLNGVLFHHNIGGGAYDSSNITYTATGVLSFFTPSNTYENLLSYGAFYAPGGSGTGGDTITIGGLTPGRNYEVQLWTPYWNFAYNTVFSATNDTAVMVAGTTSNVPEYVLGTFTADGSGQQVIAYNRFGAPLEGNASMYGALQVRDVSVATPEPSAVVLAAIGLIGLIGVRQRREE